MNVSVISKVEVEGIHYWSGAPMEVHFLRGEHRHRFVIEAVSDVSHDDRDVEFIMRGREVREYLIGKYGDPCLFGQHSCEMIARELVERFHLRACRVWEDGENGAEVTR